MDQHDPSAGTDPMAVNPADPDPGLDPDQEPEPVTASPAHPNRRGVRAALASRSAGWVVATLLAGALTGLAVNVATAPSATVVRQVSIVGPGGLGSSVSLPPPLASLRALGSCALTPTPRFIYLPAKRALVVRGSGSVTIPAPKKVAGPVKTNFIQLPVGAAGPACGLGLVAPGAQCDFVGIAPGVRFSIHAIGPGRQVYVRRPTPVKAHPQVVKVPPGVQVPALGPGVQVPALGPGVRIYCPA